MPTPEPRTAAPLQSRQRRATLFIGALALEGLPAALASGADVVCIDLEDAVPPDRKDEGRVAMLSHIEGVDVPPRVQLAVRVNVIGTHEGDDDIQAILMRAPKIGAIMLPKVESPEEIRSASRAAERARSPVELYAIIETVMGLDGCAAIVRSDPRLKALYFGGFDMATALGCEMAWEPLLYARSRIVACAALRGLEVIDAFHPEVDDLAGLREYSRRAKALGMTGKSAKDAKQVATILETFTPSEAEIARAKRIVELFRADPSRLLVYEGKLVELPTIKRMERLAAWADKN